MTTSACTVRRWRIGAVLVPVTIAALSGCGGSKGSANSDVPSIALSSGNQKVTSPAVSYLKNGTLHQSSPSLLALPVKPGGTVTITAPQEVADRGWQVQLDNKIVIERNTTRTGTLTVPTNLSGRQPLVTILAAPLGSSNRASGLWVFRLSPTGS